MSGLVGPKFENSSVHKLNSVSHKPDDLHNKQFYVEAEIDTHIIGKYNGIKALTNGNDIALQYIQNIPLNYYYYTKSKKTYIFTHLFYRIADCINNISINFPQKINSVNSINIIFYNSDSTIKSTIDFNNLYSWENDNKCLKLNYKDNHFISLMNPYGTRLCIEIDDTYDIINILQNTTLSYDLIYLDNNIRLNLSIMDSNDFNLLQT
jgi:hypothetical protein